MSQEKENLKELIIRLEKARDWLVECKLSSEEIEKNGSHKIEELKLLEKIDASLTSIDELIEKANKYANTEDFKLTDSMKKMIDSKEFQDLITKETMRQILPFFKKKD